MKRTMLLSVGLWLALVAGPVALADGKSPARVQMDGFLAAFNSGDRATVESFGREHMPPDFMRKEIIDQTMQMIETSGGYDVGDVTESTPHDVESHVRARKTKELVVLRVSVDHAAIGRITNIGFVNR